MRIGLAIGPRPAIVLPAARPTVPKPYQIPANIPVFPLKEPI